jgi:arabinofuranosyltransferase
VIWWAWAADDAFITLRTVDNALHGYGLRWNVVERVQSYTHPLWMFATLGVTWIVGSAYLAVIWLSIACSTLAGALVIWRLTDDLFASVFAVFLLAISIAFLDYSTSGLENPLTHLLIALFVLVWTTDGSGPRKTFRLALLMAAIMLNRIDAGLLVLPAFAVAAYRRPLRPHVLATIAGFVPIAIWETFSVIYYGFPFPNTAYAKLSTGISQLALLRQGMHFFANVATTDPITFATVLAALAAVIPRRTRRFWPLSLGVALYLVYILRIGGDFMTGRFFAAPFFMAVLVLCRMPLPRPWIARVALIATLVLVRFLVSLVDFGVSMSHGITDQRQLYSEGTRLITQAEFPLAERHEARRGLELQVNGPDVFEWGMIGMTGYFAGPKIHIIDVFALTDPLLARRPANPGSRIGHFRRRVPAGYVESLRSGKNMLESRALAPVYDDLVLITRGPLWTWARWGAIARLNVLDRFN